MTALSCLLNYTYATLKLHLSKGELEFNMADSRRSHGSGSIFKDKTTGAWNAQVLIGYTEQGKPKYQRVRRKSEREATDALNDLITKLNLGLPTDQPKQTLGQFLDEWLKDTVKPHREPKTYRVYEQIVRLYLKPGLGHVKLAKLNAPQVQAAFNHLSKSGGKPDADGNSTPLAAKTVKDVKGVLCSALSCAWRAGLIRDNPAKKVLTPKVEQREALFLRAEEAANLIEFSRSHYIGPLIEIALMTGLRLGEATGLTWADIDFSTGTIKIRQQLQRVNGTLILKSLKSRSSKRNLSLPKAGLDTLQEQRNRQLIASADHKGKGHFNELQLVFTSTLGRPLDGTYIDDVLKSLCTKAGVTPVSFHKLRHTAATHLAAAGIPLTVVKDQLGHSQIGLTANTYSHAVPAALKSAGDKLGEMFRKVDA
jgi:integrase